MSHIFVKSALLEHGWAHNVRLEIANGLIKAIKRDAALQPGDINLNDQILLPGVANLHSHSFQRAMAGLSERRSRSADSFWTWRDVMYRFLDHLTPSDINIIAAYAFMEMAEAGFSAVGEFHYLHHQTGGAAYQTAAETSIAIIEAAKQVGLGLTHLPVLYRFGGVEQQPLTGAQQRFGCDFDVFTQIVDGCSDNIKQGPDDFRVGVAPHSLRAVNPELMAQINQLRPHDPIHIHVAEQLVEVTDVRKKYGVRPVEWLLYNINIDARWCLVHATHMTPHETVGMAHSEAIAGLCPITEANLGDGIFDGKRFDAHNGVLGIGTDSNLRISLTEELRVLEHSQRYKQQQRTIFAKPGNSNAEYLLKAAAYGGAKALGRAAGQIKIGALADIISIKPSDWLGDELDCATALDYWVFAARQDQVHNLWSAGRHIVKDGQHIHRHKITSAFKNVLIKKRAEL